MLGSKTLKSLRLVAAIVTLLAMFLGVYSLMVGSRQGGQLVFAQGSGDPDPSEYAGGDGYSCEVDPCGGDPCCGDPCCYDPVCCGDACCGDPCCGDPECGEECYEVCSQVCWECCTVYDDYGDCYYTEETCCDPPTCEIQCY